MIRFTLIGAGRIGKIHAENIARHPEATLAYVADADQNAAAELARRWSAGVVSLEEAVSRLARFVEANMPRLISYGFYLDEGRATLTVVALHPDSASLEFHLDRGREEFRSFAELIELERIEVYGSVGVSVLEKLHDKARRLGGATVAVHDLQAGFVR